MSSVADQLNVVARIDTAKRLDLNSVEVGTKFNIYWVGNLLKNNKLELLLTHENLEPKRLFLKNIYFEVFKLLKNEIDDGKKYCVTFKGFQDIGGGYRKPSFYFEPCTSTSSEKVTIT